MPRRFVLVLAALLPCWAGPTVHAQSRSSTVSVPSRAALTRLGLERQWVTAAPVAGTEHILRISRGQDYLFVQTNAGWIHAYHVETGRPAWSTSIGEHTPLALPVSQNSYAVFATASNILTALDRHTGRIMWRHPLGTSPSSGTTADEEHVLVGLGTGLVQNLNLKEQKGDEPPKILDVPKSTWNVATGGPVHTRPLFGERIVCFGSSDGRVYVHMKDEAASLYHFVTGGPIGAELASHGTRSLLIPSADFNLYSIDVLTTKVQWVFSSGAPISQGPIVAQKDIYVVNDRGAVSSVDPETGESHWTSHTRDGKFLGVSPTKIYMLSEDGDLVVLARGSGEVLLDGAATFQRAGLDLREFTLSFPERFDDRLFLATPSGVLLCLREIGATTPSVLYEPGDKPFGHVPDEGIKFWEIANPFEEVDESEADPNAMPADQDAAPVDQDAAEAPFQ